MVERRERIFLKDLVLRIWHQEIAHIVATNSKRHLCEVVRTKAEKLRTLRDFIRRQRSARHFNHGADEIIEFYFLLLHHFARDAMNDLGLEIEFFLEADQRNHDFRLHLDLLLCDLGGGFENRSRLHFGDLRVSNSESAPAMSQHRVKLVQLRDTVRDFFRTDSNLLPEIGLRFQFVGKKFVQRWIKEPDGCRVPLERLEDSDEIFALVGQQFCQRGPSIFYIVSQNHLTHRIDAVAFEKHVFRSCKSNANGTKREGVLRLLRIIGVATNAQSGRLPAPGHELIKRLKFLGLLRHFIAMQHAGDDLAGSGRKFARVNRSRRAVDGKKVAFLKSLTCHRNRLLRVIDLKRRGPADANLSHLPCH